MKGAWLTRFQTRYASSLHLRLLALALVPLLVVLPLLIAIVIGGGGAAFDRILRNKVQADLAVANGYFDRVRDSIGQHVDAIARSHAVVNSPKGLGSSFLNKALSERDRGLRLDFLNLLDPQGRVIDSSGRLPAGFFLGDWGPVADAQRGGRSSAVDVFPSSLLTSLDPALAARAEIALRPTRNALPTGRQTETRGLVIHAAAPVFDARGIPAGLLHGGILLNRNFEFIDRIDSLVFPEGSLLEGSRGTATLFIDDVRVATNVRLDGDERAIGTRVSETVRRTTLDDGRTWLDRAFVVSDWYVSGYQPLLDRAGRRVGLLYIGFLEAPYMDLKQQSLIGIAVLFVLAVLFASSLSWRGAAAIFRPIRRMKQTMRDVEAGKLKARVGPLGRGDEIGALAADLDRLLDELQARNEALTRWGRELDAKVEVRTRELSDANKELAATNRELVMAQRQLVMSEKLAAIGELTAGMAHEINNPMAVIQGNLDLARELLGPAAEGVSHELALIDQQVERVRLIVSRLLQFARPNEYSGAVEPVAPDALFADCLVLVGHLLKRGNIAVAQSVTTSRTVLAQRNELQQVLINLLVNAIQAMVDGGTLSLEASDWDIAGHPAGVALTVRDSGPGIPADRQSRIFDPFYSTKSGESTGLGLPISASLVGRYGGRITVESAVGQGAAFTAWIPIEPLEVAERVN